MQGQILGSYRLVDKLGEGGMGEVWRARDERLNRTVAVKILPPDLAADPMRRARFEQEARSLGALNHPNIVAVYDFGQDDGRSFLVSELVDGESLRAVIDRGPLGAHKLIDYAVQMAEALAAAHELGIVHRDLKPENVMVTRAGRVKVLDFGLAKQNAAPAADRTATIALSQPGMVMGTAGYMSPEQVRGEPVDARSDIFSFGCVLYEMIGGKRAFQAPSSVETMSAILHEDPPELGAGAALPPALTPLVHRCLEKRPEQRFQSTADLAFALRAITTASGSGIHERVAAPRRRWNPWIWAVPVAALLLPAVGYFAGTQRSQRAPVHFQRITFRKGSLGNARFTPDGRNIIYEASWEGGPSRVYLGVPGNPEARDLGLPPGTRLLAMSSQEDLAYVDESGNLMRGSISGGRMRPLLDNVVAADWSPDGSALAVMREAGGKRRIEYPIGNVLVPNIVSPLDTIRVSPDGNNVAYAAFYQGRSVALHLVDRSGSDRLLGVVSGQTSSNSSKPLSWTPDGREIWFSSFDSSDTQTIYALDLKGSRRVVTNLPAHVDLYDVSKNGDALVGAGSTRWGILGSAPGDSQERDLSCLDGGILMGISDDGRLVAATISGESGGPKGSIYVRKTDGSPPVRVGDGGAYALSPDGKWVSGYITGNRGRRRFELFPTGAGEEFATDVAGLGNVPVHGWVSGGRYLVVGNLPGKKTQCFAWDAHTGSVKSVCPEGIPHRLEIYVSPDGNQVLSEGPRGGWFVYPVEGGRPQQVNGIAAGEEPFGWRSDNRSLYLKPQRTGDTATPVWSLDPGTGRRTLWKEIRPSQPVEFRYDLHLHITPDGSAYAYNISAQTSDLYLAQGLR